MDAAALQENEGGKKVDHGFACVHAVRDAVGSEMLINVDLHGRLNLFGARQIFRELEATKPFWIEVPIREKSNAYDVYLDVCMSSGVASYFLSSRFFPCPLNDWKVSKYS